MKEKCELARYMIPTRIKGVFHQNCQNIWINNFFWMLTGAAKILDAIVIICTLGFYSSSFEYMLTFWSLWRRS